MMLKKIMIIILTLSLLAIIYNTESFAEEDLDIVKLQSTSMHSPIRIEDNINFTNENGVSSGTGTENDPFIIENYEIDGSGDSSCIYIYNTNAHVIIRNCTLYGASGMGIHWAQSPGSGIFLYYAENVTIRDCLIYQNKDGAGVCLRYFCYDCKIINNTIFDNFHGVVSWGHAERIFIENNNIYNNPMIAIYTHYTFDTVINRNEMFNNSMGIYVNNGDLIEIENNTISDMYRGGIKIDDAKFTTILNNSLWGCGIYGIFSEETISTIEISESNNVNGNPILFMREQENLLISKPCGQIILFRCYNISLSSMHIKEIETGISIIESNACKAFNNSFTNCSYGVYLNKSSNNLIYHNNFINSDGYNELNNYWNYTYPTGGNYWSRHYGVDLFNGTEQIDPGRDAIADSPFYVSFDATDFYPLMHKTDYDINWTLLSDITPPIINIPSSNFTIGLGDYLTIDASNSTDDLSIANISWNFSEGDCGIYEVYIYGSSFNYNFTHPGNYDIILTIEDISGNVNSTSIIVSVIDTRPIVNNVMLYLSIIMILTLSSIVLIYKRRRKEKHE